MPTASQPVFRCFWLSRLWRRRGRVRVVECCDQTLVRLEQAAPKNRREHLTYSRSGFDADFKELINRSLIGFELPQSHVIVFRQLLESVVAVEHFCNGEVGRPSIVDAVGEVRHLPQ